MSQFLYYTIFFKHGRYYKIIFLQCSMLYVEEWLTILPVETHMYTKLCNTRVGQLQVMQLCFMLDALLGESTEPLNTDELECVFIQSLYGSLGASIVAEDRIQFDALIKKTTGFMTVDDSDVKFAGYRKYLSARYL